MNKFQVSSGKLIISDPCYSRDDDTFIVKAKNGEWSVSIDNNRLVAHHIDYPESNDNLKNMPDFTQCVDSGQIGIFDDDIYPYGNTGKHDDLNTFYGKCCNDDYIIIDNAGVNTPTPFGDGCFPVYLIKDGDDVVRILIDFDDDGDDDEYIDCDDEYCRFCAEELRFCSCDDDDDPEFFYPDDDDYEFFDELDDCE